MAVYLHYKVLRIKHKVISIPLAAAWQTMCKKFIGYTMMSN